MCFNWHSILLPSILRGNCKSDWLGLWVEGPRASKLCALVCWMQCRSPQWNWTDSLGLPIHRSNLLDYPNNHICRLCFQCLHALLGIIFLDHRANLVTYDSQTFNIFLLAHRINQNAFSQYSRLSITAVIAPDSGLKGTHNLKFQL